jgi:GrpB-like predicted nucleotidyltransferase (UPF0157 family)
MARQLAEVGLGLAYDELRLEPTTDAWLAAGAALREHVAIVVGATAVRVEHVGSSAVRDMVSKPVVDLAVGVVPGDDIAEVGRRLDDDGWIYRGDARDEGGHVFVLETRPWHRVAHLHVVGHGSDQWTNYLRLRDRLRTSSEARQRYATDKLRLLAACGNDREAYTRGKTEVVLSLIGADGDEQS